jgi:microcystin-dependent protein
VASVKYANNASSLLAASITNADLAIQVASGTNFPSPGAGEYFLVALVNAAGDLEIAKIESRSGNILTVAAGGRGQEGTTAAAWTLNITRVELRLTRGTMENLLQKTGDAMSGDLDMDTNDIIDARMTGDTTIVGGQTVGTAIRGTEDDSSNELSVPSDGTRATAGGQRVMTQDDDVPSFFPTGAIMMWYGSLLSIPSGWALCDGASGTPDLRGRFVIGAGGAYALGATGGSATLAGSTSSNGAHSHTITVDSHTLTAAEIPAHSHTIHIEISSSLLSAVADHESVVQDAAIGRTAFASPPPYLDIDGATDSDGGSGGGHNHTASSASTGNHTHSLSGVASLPPYTGLYYIMKT